ncbi:hypothetical protein [Pseudonocardia sp. KRD291]|uniref:hypothetical protein n=1 Tax=Pseudonocardia sp. KRD291 TaxID=2792007 RepID=UPI001C4A7222|nr:hypothetical protein [Pseudonocardia sp. KRD291]MBW0103457.1 hypothetical protein [Pseudonocardia sp. KRD291]
MAVESATLFDPVDEPADRPADAELAHEVPGQRRGQDSLIFRALGRELLSGGLVVEDREAH